MPKKPVPAFERLMRRVDKNTEGGCWQFTGPLMPNGYSRTSAGGKDLYGHRVAYETLVGPIPDGLVLDHLCRNRGCVNPAHLEPVTSRVNVAVRGNTVPAAHAAKTACDSGHQFTPENTYTRPYGGRDCRACARIRKSRASAKKKAAA